MCLDLTLGTGPIRRSSADHVGTVDACRSDGKSSKEGAMNEELKNDPPKRMVVVVGIDLSEVSAHLLARARDLVRSIDDADLHLVHVVVDPLRWAAGPVHPSLLDTHPQVDLAQEKLHQLSNSVLGTSRAQVFLHTPVGNAADQITRLAREVHADIIVVEMHERSGLQRVFHRSSVPRITQTAPCSVLAIRDPVRVAMRPQTSKFAA